MPIRVIRSEIPQSLVYQLGEQCVDRRRSFILRPMSNTGQNMKGDIRVDILDIGADTRQIRIECDVGIPEDTVKLAGKVAETIGENHRTRDPTRPQSRFRHIFELDRKRQIVRCLWITDHQFLQVRSMKRSGFVNRQIGADDD